MASSQETSSPSSYTESEQTDRCFILQLPVELLVMIIKSIRWYHLPSDVPPDPPSYMLNAYDNYDSWRSDYILDHIALQSSCRTFQKLYMGMEKLWRQVCVFHGWGFPQAPPEYALRRDKWPLEGKTWRDMAILLSGHIQSCHIVECGEQFGSHEKNWSLLAPSHQLPADDKLDCQATLIGVKFPFSFWHNFKSFRLIDGEADPKRGRPYEPPFIDHLTKACSFATLPPVPTMMIEILGVYAVEVMNPDGVTVWDAVYQMAESLSDLEFDLYALLSLYRLHRCRYAAPGPWSRALEVLDSIADMTPRQLLMNAQKLVASGGLSDQDEAERYLNLCGMFIQAANGLEDTMSILSLLILVVNDDTFVELLRQETLAKIVNTFTDGSNTGDSESEWDTEELWDVSYLDAFLVDSILWGLKAKLNEPCVFRTMWDDEV